MLTLRLLEGEPTSDKQDAIAYYTELLLRNQHPDADVIGQALDALESKWTRGEIASAATQTAGHAREYLKKNHCRPCLEATGVQEKLFDARQQKLYKMHNALPKLDELTKRE